MACVGVSVIKCIKTGERSADPAVDNGKRCLYIRRDIAPNGSWVEYSYVGPEAEVNAMAERAREVDTEKLDALLRAGNSFDAALKKLGK